MKNIDLVSAQLIRERYSQLLALHKLSMRAFARKLGLDYTDLYAMLKKDKAPSLALFNATMQCFPTLNPWWLLLGYGAMLQDARQVLHLRLDQLLQEATQEVPVIDELELWGFIEKLEIRIWQLSKKNEALKKEIDQLQSQLQNKSKNG